MLKNLSTKQLRRLRDLRGASMTYYFNKYLELRYPQISGKYWIVRYEICRKQYSKICDELAQRRVCPKSL